jgi:hypothetical protein
MLVWEEANPARVAYNDLSTWRPGFDPQDNDWITEVLTEFAEAATVP